MWIWLIRRRHESTSWLLITHAEADRMIADQMIILNMHNAAQHSTTGKCPSDAPIQTFLGCPDQYQHSSLAGPVGPVNVVVKLCIQV